MVMLTTLTPLKAEPEVEAEPIRRETLELPDEEDFTMDDEPRGNAPAVARDVLDIGEIDTQ